MLSRCPIIPQKQFVEGDLIPNMRPFFFSLYYDASKNSLHVSNTLKDDENRKRK